MATSREPPTLDAMSSSSATNLDVFQTWMPSPARQDLPRKSLGVAADRDRESARDKNRRLVKQAFASRKDKFFTTNGQLRHGQPLAVVPYPMSYDREWLEM